MFEPHQESLFPHSTHEPLASRIRPQTIDAIVGQEHLLGKGKARTISARTETWLTTSGSKVIM